jgi:hypothetical protein
MLPSDTFHWKINDNFAGGVPDLFIEGPETDLWVEVKYLKNIPKRPSTVIDLTNHSKYLSKLQQQWLKRRYARRGDCGVLLGMHGGVVWFPGISWENPVSTAEILERRTTSKAIIGEFLLKT